MSLDDETKERITFGRFVNEHSLQHIGFLDQKSSILVAINGVLLGLLFQSNVAKVLTSQSPFLFDAAVVLLGASAVFGLFTIIPQRRKAKKDYSTSLLFNETIYKRMSHEYKDKLVDLNPDTILEEEALNAHRLAKAVNYQFNMVTWSIRLLILAVALLVVLLLLVQPYFAALH